MRRSSDNAANYIVHKDSGNNAQRFSIINKENKLQNIKVVILLFI